MASFASMQDAKAKIKAAEELDPSIFDYDSFHDTKASVTNAKKAAAQKDAIERKPKYKNQFFEAAAKRKQDQQISRDKLLQRNREAEGEEFADKEKFVTGAYKKQQEENRLAEEEERQKNDADEQRRSRLGGSGMQGFYRNIIDQRERQYRDDVAATNERREQSGNSSTNPDSSEQQKEKSDAELAAEAQARGVSVHLNDEGQITDKRQLLSAGLNVGAPKSRNGSSRGTAAAEHLRMSNSQRQPGLGGGRGGVDQRQAQRERQSRMLEEQLAAQNKRAREEEEEEKARLERAAKSTKTDREIGDARARYLARKAAKERGEG